MGVLSTENSLQAATAQLLAPQSEQGESSEPEQETPEQETELVEEEELPTEDTEEVDEIDGEEEEVGGDLEDDQPSEEDEEPLAANSDDEFYSVKVDGAEYEVNLEELKKGYQLEKNYTKKSQQLAEEQKELATLKEQVQAERDKYLQINQQLAQQQATELEAAKADLAAIDRNDDPLGFVQKQLDIQAIEQDLNNRQAQMETAKTQELQAQQVRMQQYVQEQSVLLAEQLEGWNDPEQAKAIQDGILKFAMTQGYSDADLANVTSARDIIVLNKARLYDEMQSKKAQVRQKRAPRKASPKVRAAQPKGESAKKARAVKAKRDQFKSSGSVKDAQQLMTDLMLRKPIKKR